MIGGIRVEVLDRLILDQKVEIHYKSLTLHLNGLIMSFIKSFVLLRD